MSLKRPRASSRDILEGPTLSLGPDMDSYPAASASRVLNQSSKGYRRTGRRLVVRRRFALKRPVGAVSNIRAAMGLGTTHVMNRDREFIHRLSKTVVVNTLGGTSTAQNGREIFDPSGTFGTGFGSGAAADTMPEWTSLTGLFDQYHVNDITITVTAAPGGSVAGQTLDTAPVILYGRYSYDKSATVSSSADFGKLAGCKQHLFTTANPVCSWKIYPRICNYTATTGVLSLQGEEVRKQGWTDVGFPDGVVWVRLVFQ